MAPTTRRELARLYDQMRSLGEVLEELVKVEDFDGPLLSDEEARQILVEEYGSVEKMEQALDSIARRSVNR